VPTSADNLSSAKLVLKDGSSLTGAVNPSGPAKSAAISIDDASKWVVTGTSHLTTLAGASGISGTTVSNIVGDGHTPYYSAKEDASLDGKVYTLAGGGKLVPD